jgi:hypothetical protein
MGPLGFPELLVLVTILSMAVAVIVVPWWSIRQEDGPSTCPVPPC